MLWWKLPGPGAFVASIVNDLRDGRNVVVCLPTNTPPDLRSAVQDGYEWGGAWSTLSCEDFRDCAPLSGLYKRFVPCEDQFDLLQSTRDLVQRPGFVGHVIWVDDLSPREWTEWRRFLEDYQVACRGIEGLRRTIFCVKIAGVAATELCKEDVCLAVHKYDQSVSSLDMYLYASSQLQDETELPVLKELRLELIASLAQWDGMMVAELATLDLHELLQPLDCLRQLAVKHGIDLALPEKSEEAWHMGATYRMRDKWVVHSCACAVANVNEVTLRIWRAQLRALYPFVEEQRQAIIEQVRPYLKNQDGSMIEDVQSLEVAHLHKILHENSRFQQLEVLDRVAVLRNVRNQLAHRCVMNPNDLRTPAFQAPLASS